MGQPCPPPEPHFGDDCLDWFAAGKTPLFICASIGGVEDCDPGFPPARGPIPQHMQLEQDVMYPCDFAGGEAQDYNCWLFLRGDGSSELSLYWRNLMFFFDDTQVDFHTTYTNQLTCDYVLLYGQGGNGQVSWYPTPGSPSIKVTLDRLNMGEEEGRKYDCWPVHPDKMVVRFVRVKESTNIHILQHSSPEGGAPRKEGEPCTNCWSEGKFWEDETVPKYVFCTLSGFDEPVSFLNWVFEPGEPIKVGAYVLTQKNCPDCTYELLDSEKEIIWTPDDVLSTLVVTTKPDNIVRMDADAGGCFKLFQKDQRRAEINY